MSESLKAVMKINLNSEENKKAKVARRQELLKCCMKLDLLVLPEKKERKKQTNLN